MTRMPVLFVSHGSPELAVRETPAHMFLRDLAAILPRPRAFLVVSAHWETDNVQVAQNRQPPTIHDFGGFDPRLRQMTYRAPGAPDIGELAFALLQRAGFSVSADPDAGYDHGVWVPLKLLCPAADVPVAQVSVQPRETPRHHYDLGKALRPLRDDGVLILASGALTHNLRELTRVQSDTAAPGWVLGFTDWFAEKIETGDKDALLDYRRHAPHAERNHPTDEHLLPIFSALGAAGDESLVRLHHSYEHGVLAMDVYGSPSLAATAGA